MGKTLCFFLVAFGFFFIFLSISPYQHIFRQGLQNFYSRYNHLTYTINKPYYELLQLDD